MWYLLIRIGLLWILYHYARTIVNTKYISSTYEKLTDWLIYLLVAAALLFMSIYFDGSIFSLIIVGLIVFQSILIIINTYQSMKLMNILQFVILVLITLLFVLQLFSF